MITKKQILDAMLEHMTSAYDNGNINNGGIHGGGEAADAILNLLQADVIKSLPIDFVKWYSGMEEDKILKAVERWKKESGNVL